MPNPYLTAALRAQDPQRPKRTPKTSAKTEKAEPDKVESE
jgi:hypothetical protein